MLVVFPSQETLLSHRDREFIATALGTSEPSRQSLLRMLGDPEAVDIILDSGALHQAILARSGDQAATSQLDFYLLVRPALQRVGVDDRGVARYLAALLASFAYVERSPEVLVEPRFSPEHLAGMTKSLQHTTTEGRFMLLAYMGNYALLMGGLFPETLPAHSDRPDLPDLAYCDKLGRASFMAAAHQPLAWEFLVHDIFSQMAEHFRAIRVALADLAEQGIFPATAATGGAVRQW